MPDNINEQTENKPLTLEEVLSKLPDDYKSMVQSTVDRERARASKTAYENAKTKLATDNEFLGKMESTFKEKFQKEASMTAEERLASEKQRLEEERNNFLKEQNKWLVKQSLQNELGLGDDEMDSLYPLLLGDSVDSTKSRVNAYVTTAKATAEKLAKAQLDKQLASYTNPNTGDSKVNQNATLQQAYEQAVKRQDYTEMARLAREIQTKK